MMTLPFSTSYITLLLILGSKPIQCGDFVGGYFDVFVFFYWFIVKATLLGICVNICHVYLWAIFSGTSETFEARFHSAAFIELFDWIKIHILIYMEDFGEKGTGITNRNWILIDPVLVHFYSEHTAFPSNSLCTTNSSHPWIMCACTQITIFTTCTLDRLCNMKTPPTSSNLIFGKESQ